LRTLSLCLFIAYTLVASGCSGGATNQANSPPIDDSRNGGRPAAAAPAPAATGMSTTKKVVLLAGAAALYYMYEHHKTAEAGKPQYYLSKNGRVYYRDPATHQAHWVTPPPQGISVPAADAQKYSDFQGYENKPNGKTLAGVGQDANE
jgi:hypothetical protein